MLAYLKRTTIEVDDEVEARMRQEAARRGITVSEWLREAVVAHLPGSGGSGVNRTFRFAGAGASGRSDISVHSDELLGEMGLADHADGRDPCRVEDNECQVWSSPHVRPRDGAAFTLLPG